MENVKYALGAYQKAQDLCPPSDMDHLVLLKSSSNLNTSFTRKQKIDAISRNMFLWNRIFENIHTPDWNNNPEIRDIFINLYAAISSISSKEINKDNPDTTELSKINSELANIIKK